MLKSLREAWYITSISLLTIAGIIALVRGTCIWRGSHTFGSKVYLVTDKAIDQGLNVIYTEQGTLQIKDSLLYLQYRSSDVYGSIAKGSCYQFHFHVFYFRIPLFTMYPNIIKQRKVDCP